MPAGKKFAIGVNLLTGRYVATSHNNRREAEWPPHMARLFSALVAMWAENGKDPIEREALTWLESQKPPTISASEASPRTVVSHFVPVNDAFIFPISRQLKKAANIRELTERLTEELAKSGGKDTKSAITLREKIGKEKSINNNVGSTAPNSTITLFPEKRGKQERFYPSVTPHDRRVAYVWDAVPPEKLRNRIDDMLERVTRLGHTSSLVSCMVMHEHPIPTYVPDDVGLDIRSIRGGQIAALEQKYEVHKGINPRTLPYTNVRYRRNVTWADGRVPVMPNTAGEWIMFEFAHDSRVFPSTRTVDVARAVSAEFVSRAAGNDAEEITGHRPDGLPATSPHVAFLPIPYSGSRHSDGRLLGVALALPKALSDSARKRAYEIIGEWEGKILDRVLTFKIGSGYVHMSRLRGLSSLITLRSEAWSRRSRRWVSVTPISLPRHPGSLSRGTQNARAKAWDAARLSVSVACEHVGLPRPSAVEISLEPFIDGARPVAHFPAFTQKGADKSTIRRQLIHASLTFENEVEGPLVLGTGRFFGLGLMRPRVQSRGRQDG